MLTNNRVTSLLSIKKYKHLRSFVWIDQKLIQAIVEDISAKCFSCNDLQNFVYLLLQTIEKHKFTENDTVVVESDRLYSLFLFLNLIKSTLGLQNFNGYLKIACKQTFLRFC